MLFDSSRQLGQSVGAKLRVARQAKKYTQGQLARPEFSVSYISAIERGQIQPSLRALDILTKRLGLSTSDLLPHQGQAANGQTAGKVEPALQEDERDLVLLEAQIALHQADAELAIALLFPLITQKGHQQQDIYTSTLLGRAYLEGGHLQESEQILAGIARQAREEKHPFYPYILSLQSAVYAAMHNAAATMRLLQESLALLEREPGGNIFLLSRVYTSLGQHHSSQGHVEQARAMFAQALATVQGQTSYQQLQTVYGELLQNSIQREDSPETALYSHKWLLAGWQLQLGALRSEIRHTLGRVWLKYKPDEAYTYLLAERQDAEIRHDALLRASADTHLASWLVAHERFDEAEPYARAARDCALPFGETAIAAEADLLLGEIVYRQQEYEEGDQFFEAGLLILEHLQKEEELAEHLTHYASLLENRGLIQKALTYWRQAYEHRQKNRQRIF